MIINCINCDKKFNVDQNLIPNDGRLLKCGKCGNEWFFKINDNRKNIEIKNNNIEENQFNNENLIKSINPKINNENIENEKTIDTKKENNINNKNEISSKNILKFLIIFLITLIGVILLIDTFKLYIANFFPNIITILNSLYATLYDLLLFLKDLFN